MFNRYFTFSKSGNRLDACAEGIYGQKQHALGSRTECPLWVVFCLSEFYHPTDRF